jgi:DNA helicase-2/ATP-dependent DNA helicase PcrA
MELGDNPPVAEAEFDVDAVNVLTVHKAKGLEFRVVFLVGLVMGTFPHSKRPTLIELPSELIREPLPELSDSEILIHEERRLFYVGMTRAKEELILTSAQDYGGKRERSPSQFIMEALDLSKDEIVMQKVKPLERIENFRSSIEEKKLVIRGKFSLSSTAIEDWINCPRKYWYVHWLKIPTPRHHTIVYGSAIHKTIEKYLAEKRRGHKFGLNKLLKTFEHFWVNEGFISRAHEEARFKEGKEALKRFFEQEEKNESIPTFVEESFYFWFDDIKITGRWDRIDTKEDGKAVIIDYKTGEVDTLEKAKQRVSESVQLPIYALAYLERFNSLPERVEFYFVDTNIRAELRNIEKKVESIKEVIQKVIQGIRACDFNPRPKYSACEFCACRAVCDYNK